MSEKAIVDIYYSYGKGDGEKLSERYVINNTVKEREEVFENVGYDDLIDNKEDFINGKIDIVSFARYGGDWDEPTGGYFEVNTKSELIGAIEAKAQSEVKRIEDLFENN